MLGGFSGLVGSLIIGPRYRAFEKVEDPKTISKT
jgi:hypothetical protein